jgi:hypothetical protein
MIAVAMMVLGGMLLFKKMKYDVATTATVTGVICQGDTNKCNITLRYKDSSNREITRTAIVKGPVTVNSTRGILYDSSNPSNFYPGQPPVKLVGGGMLAAGVVVALGCIIAAYYHYRPTPQSVLEPEPEPEPEPKQEPEPSYMSKSESESDFPSEPQSNSVRAKEYADFLVDKVTKPARSPKTNNEFDQTR